MERLVFVIPLVCWLLAARSPRYRLGVGVALAAIAATQLVVSFLAWTLREVQYSVEVLLTLASVGILVVGLITDRAAGGMASLRTALGGVLVVLYCVASPLGVLLMLSFWSDYFPSYGGKPVPVPAADQVLPLPDGLVVLADSSWCSESRRGPWCHRVLSIGSTDGTPDSGVADRLLQHLRDSRGLPLELYSSGSDGREWDMCRNTGWWLDRAVETIDLTTRTPGPQHGDLGIGWPEGAPEGSVTVVTIGMTHLRCEA
ncbi:hypothetical protein [Nocardia sp. bgisy134]|uniref:hypothetical protein n=1 Tax=Nocardia sp. bgisy134 TaxID=3413789 RepID=UPI003D745658